MSKTIFNRLMKLSLCVLLMSVLVLGTVHFSLIQHYMNSAKTRQVQNEVARIKELTGFLVENYTQGNYLFYLLNINKIASANDCIIVVSDDAGNILAGSENGFDDKKIDVKPFADIVNGKKENLSIVINHPRTGKRLLAVSTSIYINGGTGFVAMLFDMPAVDSETYTMIGLLLISVGIAALFSLVLSYFLSKNIQKPIKKLSEHAKEIGKGNFTKIGISSGVTELDELGDTFDIMAEELEKQEKSRASFLANVSHDLRTPMTTISGFVQGILDDTIPKEKEKEYLKVVLSETHRLSDLISSFIDASKYDAGEIKLYITETDINGMLKNAVTQFEQGISGKNLTVNFELDPQVTGVLADQQAISRVVVNLIDNAVKFSKQDGTLFVSTKSEGQKVYVKIENTGEEISGEDLKYIWDRFYKTDKSRLRDKKGVGLGLYIVKNIIAKHGEKITVTCENGIISFTFSLQNNI